MRTHRTLLLVVLLTAAILLAFLLAGPARDWIILPLAKLWWMLKGAYGSFPQIEYWIALLFVVALLLIYALFSMNWGERSRSDDERHNPGEVQQLAYWISRSQRGFYSRWHVARQLGDLALEILEAGGINARVTRRLQGIGWNPPARVQRYLETALRTSFADFSRKGSNGLADALDIDVNEVIEYLESIVEIEHEPQKD